MAKAKTMSLAVAAKSLTKKDLRKYLMTAGSILAIFAGMTSTKKDDAGAALFNGIVLDDDKFDQLCEMLGIEDELPTPPE